MMSMIGLAYQVFIFCQKSILSNCFTTVSLTQPFNEMFNFIVSSKCSCCNDTFTNVFFTLLLTKNI